MSDIINKRCSSCKEIKAVEEYYKNGNTKDGYRLECFNCCTSIKEKDIEYQRLYHLKNHKKRIISNWIRHGISYPDFNELYNIYLSSTNCFVCDVSFDNRVNKKGKCLDHHKSSKAPRVLVCRNCNLNVLTKLDRLRDKLLLELHRYFINNIDKFILHYS